MSEWEKMESAPKDGRWYLVSIEGQPLPFFARWDARENTGLLYEVPEMSSLHSHTGVVKAIAWMPLPPPPEVEG